jgi:hypothetical protein
MIFRLLSNFIFINLRNYKNLIINLINIILRFKIFKILNFKYLD